ncbi:MAG: hypothetical protein H6867_01575 [Rhodospirillales bacterium]|nr:hypothetical protein [Rhodospirillales bacterium]MCB9997207.1 hypothetical protein [Rhodospirillales bacterium]
MIMNHDDIEAFLSADPWTSGRNAPVFNEQAGITTQEAPRRVSMAPANDVKPGVLGYNR